MLIELDFFLCTLRSGIYVDHLSEDTTPPMPPTPGRKKDTCVSTGAAYCAKKA